jgi:Protein of unknown function (DUF3800)
LGATLYLLYVDESGNPRGRENEYFVVAGISLHEQDSYPFARSVDGLLSLNHRHLELHASRIWSARHEWSHVSGPVRRQIVRSVFDHLGSWRSPDGRAPRFFAVAIHKPSFPGVDIVTRAHEELFRRFDTFIARLHHEGRSHRALVIADESSYENLLQDLVPKWKLTGSRIGRLHSFAEVPLYIDSKASRVIQAADFVAWAVWHYYEHGHSQHLQEFHRRFDSDAGIQHGLAHLVKDYRTCDPPSLCVPCHSRRLHVVRNTLTRLTS